MTEQDIPDRTEHVCGWCMGLDISPPPVDPAQAALEARRNRNTGPQRRGRAPKNVGWGRGRA